MLRPAALAVLLLLAGCATRGDWNVPGREPAMLFGSLKVPDGYDWVVIGKAFSNGGWPGVQDAAGNFAVFDMPAGEYGLAGFKKNGRIFQIGNGNPEHDARYTFQLAPGEIRYAGSWEVADITPATFGLGSFTMEERSTPRPNEILEALLPQLIGTPWEGPVRKAMRPRETTASETTL